MLIYVVKKIYSTILINHIPKVRQYQKKRFQISSEPLALFRVADRARTGDPRHHKPIL